MVRNYSFIGSLMVLATVLFLMVLLQYRPAVPDGVPEISAVVVDDIDSYLIYRSKFASK